LLASLQERLESLLEQTLTDDSRSGERRKSTYLYGDEKSTADTADATDSISRPTNRPPPPPPLPLPLDELTEEDATDADGSATLAAAAGEQDDDGSAAAHRVVGAASTPPHDGQSHWA